MNNPDQLSSFLIIILVIMFFIFISLSAFLLFLKFKSKKKEEETTGNTRPMSDAKKIAKEYTKESIFKFMEFDKIEDNMIIQKNGMRYLMVVECQGVNYDLMSESEKISVEEGFLQFLNTLRHPIQIYVQTRTVNLNDSLENYRKKVDEIGVELEKKKTIYLRNLQTNNYSKEELEKQFYEVTKQTNLYEYGKDIINNTEKMSLNKNVLNKKYYIILSYFPEEATNSSFDKEEVRGLAFSELYTKSQAIIRTLAGCEVNGRIMTSNELIDLLYVAYNRDEAEVFSVDRAARAGYEELYTTAPDVLDKKMRILDEEIEKQALVTVNEKVLQARSQRQQRYEQKQSRFEELIRQRAEMILKQNANYIGKNTTNDAIELLKEETKEKGGEQDVEQKEVKTTRRKKASAK